uniref:Agmatinase n=1 Tax=Octactis speculum TaxID=3111310 RepID=A0A7S2GXC4_9STRA
MIHIDAHCDTSNSLWGSDDHHGAPFRRAVEKSLISPKHVIQIGIRGAQNNTEGWDYSKEHFTVVYMHEVDEVYGGIAGVLEKARNVVGDRPTYITFDIDSLDPVIAPGTGTPEVGGLTSSEALRFLRGLKGLNIVGADMVEVSPPFDVGGPGGGLTSLAGSTIAFELLCLLAMSVAEKRN